MLWSRFRDGRRLREMALLAGVSILGVAALDASRAVASIGSAVKPLVATPSPTPTPGSLTNKSLAPLPVATQPPPPTGLHATTDVGECQQHGGNFICAALAPGAGTFTVLVWAGLPSAQSYTVYRLGGGVAGTSLHSMTKLGTNAAKFDGVIPSAYSIDKVVAGQCFAVTQTVGGLESDASAKFCPGASAQNVTIAPGHVLTLTTPGTAKCSAVDFGGTFVGANPPSVSPGLTVGYSNTSTSCTGYGGLTRGQIVSGAWSRGAAFFDVTKLSGRMILKALLMLPVASSTPSGASCVRTVSGGASLWWNDQTLAPGMPQIDATPLAGAVDVTSLVAAWALGVDHGGIPNYGVILQGAHEDLTVGTCSTTYGTPTLVVTTQ